MLNLAVMTLCRTNVVDLGCSDLMTLTKCSFEDVEFGCTHIM